MPTKCVTKTSEKSIKDAAKLKNDDLYNEIKDVDLMSKNLYTMINVIKLLQRKYHQLRNQNLELKKKVILKQKFLI